MAARFVPGTWFYVLAICAGCMVAGLALMVPRILGGYMMHRDVEGVMSTLTDAFNDGAQAYATGIQSVPAAQHHSAYLLGYMSSRLPGCTAETMKQTLEFSICYIPSGKLQADGNYVLSLSRMHTQLPRFEADGRPLNATGNRINMPSSADNVQTIGFYFSAPDEQFNALAQQFLSLFSSHRLSDIPPNGMWDVHPDPRFGVRSCFLHHQRDSVGANCYPEGQPA